MSNKTKPQENEQLHAPSKRFKHRKMDDEDHIDSDGESFDSITPKKHERGYFDTEGVALNASREFMEIDE